MAPRRAADSIRRAFRWPRGSGDDDDLQALLPALEGFHARFGRFFRRSEGRAFGRKYLIGLTLPIERKNAENIAEQVGASPGKLHEFLSESPWHDDRCIGELQRSWVSSSGLRVGCSSSIELTKGEVGLDQYEVTRCRGWYHHITMSLMTLAFLNSVQREWGKKRSAHVGAGGAPAA